MDLATSDELDETVVAEDRQTPLVRWKQSRCVKHYAEQITSRFLNSIPQSSEVSRWHANVASRAEPCRNHLAGSSGLAGWEGVADFSLARDSSTRFLKSSRSLCSNPL